jgi:hypothetical protein
VREHIAASCSLPCVCSLIPAGNCLRRCGAVLTLCCTVLCYRCSRRQLLDLRFSVARDAWAAVELIEDLQLLSSSAGCAVPLQQQQQQQRQRPLTVLLKPADYYDGPYEGNILAQHTQQAGVSLQVQTLQYCSMNMRPACPCTPNACCSAICCTMLAFCTTCHVNSEYVASSSQHTFTAYTGLYNSMH